MTHEVDGTVDSLGHDAAIVDAIPDGWTVHGDFFDVEEVRDDDNEVVLEDVTAAEEEDSARRSYAIEAPGGVAETGAYDFGPAVAVTDEIDAEERRDEVAGTDIYYVVGPSTNVLRPVPSWFPTARSALPR
jgi:hypothetical protein